MKTLRGRDRSTLFDRGPSLMIEKPKPLSLDIEPKAILKAMLESADRKDRGLSYPTPMHEVNPASLDELVSRIDSGALALNQVPDPKDIADLVDMYWSMRSQFALEQQMAQTAKPRKKAAQSVVTVNFGLSDLLKTEE